MIKHVCKSILYKTGMIDSEAMQKMVQFFDRIIWPPSISRLPPLFVLAILYRTYSDFGTRQVARGAGSIKADQWRSQISVFFVGLFEIWQVDGEIPDINAEPSPPNTKNAAAQAVQEKLVRARMRENLWSSRWLTDETRLPYKIGGGWPVTEDPMSKGAIPFSVNSERCAIRKGSSSWLCGFTDQHVSD
jgi:hypothetical protein